MKGRFAGLLLCLLLAVGPALAQASLVPNGEQTFVDQNGAPYAAGKVYFYIPNTLTPKTTWSNSTETTPNSNPVVLDSAGRAVIYGSGVYRQVLKDLFGNTIWDQLTDAGSPGALVVNAVITVSTNVTSCSGLFPVVNGSSAPITITMPSSPNVGDNCQFADVGNNAGTFPVTFVFPGHTFASGQSSWIMNQNQEEVGFTWLGTPANWAAQ